VGTVLALAENRPYTGNMENNNYDAIIIGAGIGGLVAGNILAKNGQKVLILEKNHVPGGGVTTFYRNGYPLDITHALCALGKDKFLGRAFSYLNIYDKFEFVPFERAFIYYPSLSEKPISCFADPQRYTEELTQYFPNYSNSIKKFFSQTFSIWDNEILKSYYNPSLPRLISYLFRFPRLVKYQNYTFDKYLNCFTNSPELKNILSVGWPYLGLEKERVSALYMTCLLGAYHKDKSYFVKGGFGKIPEVLASNFKQLGGQIIYNNEVEKVYIDKSGEAKGVLDKYGSIKYAKTIISNSDCKKSFTELVGKECLPKNFLKRIDNLKMSCSVIQVHVAAKAKVPKEHLSCGSIVLPFKIDPEKRLKETLKSNIPLAGTSCLVASIVPIKHFTDSVDNDIFIFNLVWFPANFQLWKELISSKGRTAYDEIKQEVLSLIIGEAKKIWDIEEVKFSHILTPLSTEKWLNATEGAIYDAACSPNQMLLNRLKHKTPIKNYYLVGTKTFPGIGIAGATLSAFSLGDILLKGKISKGKFVIS